MRRKEREQRSEEAYRREASNLGIYLLREIDDTICKQSAFYVFEGDNSRES